MDATPTAEAVSIGCERCQHLEIEVAELRRQLALIHDQNDRSRTVQWWTAACFSVLCVAVAPQLPTGLMLWSLTQNFGIDWPIFVFQGTSIGMAWAQWTLITTFCLLLNAPIWQKALMYVGWSGLAILFWLPLMYQFFSDGEPLVVAWLAPFVSLLLVIPIVIVRFASHWTLVWGDNGTEARPVSIAGYFGLITIAATVLTLVRYLPWQEMGLTLDNVWILVAVLAGPMVAMAVANYLLLAMYFRDPSRSFWPYPFIILSISLIACGISFAGYAAIEGLDSIEVVMLFLCSIVLMAEIPLALAYWVMRCLGYRIATSRMAST